MLLVFISEIMKLQYDPTVTAGYLLKMYEGLSGFYKCSLNCCNQRDTLQVRLAFLKSSLPKLSWCHTLKVRSHDLGRQPRRDQV